MTSDGSGCPFEALFGTAPDDQEKGLVCVTDTVTPDMVLAAYRRGVFPWSREPVRWYAPPERAVFFPESVRVPRSLRREARRDGLRVTYDQSFSEVILGCVDAHGREDTWICPSIVATYLELHRRHLAHSVEVWRDGCLVGGLYGVQIGGIFFGESMFHRANNASKVAFAAVVDAMPAAGIEMFDAQVMRGHTKQWGAVALPRSEFERRLQKSIAETAPWSGARWPSPPAPGWAWPDERPRFFEPLRQTQAA